jgi:hypothetical protein
MKELILNLARQLAFWSLNIVLKQYMKLADEDKNGELSLEEIKKSKAKIKKAVKDLQAFLGKFEK